MTTPVIVDTTHSPYARLRPVPINAVTLTDNFWAPRLKTLRETTLPTQLAQIEQTGRLDNFRYAAGLTEHPPQGYVFNDSDVYKWLEAVFWSALDEGDLCQSTAKVIEAVLAAQQPDGYLNTAFMFAKADQRWTNIRDLHELYCAGHFIQAAIAAHRSPTKGKAKGEDVLLSTARRLADLICNTFGPNESGKTPTVPGHQEIEIALLELYRLTRDRKYLDQAQYFLDARGHGLIGGSPYHQDHSPYRSLTRHAGHAVRALYMNIAAADLYAETGDPTLLETLVRLWDHTTSRQMYITGGLGARHSGESFGDDYELPNHQAYCETCAAIASVMWNYRMTLITCGNSITAGDSIPSDARYTDLLEHTLYNAVLPGISLDGQRYFYVNPLASEGDHQRQPWFPCACCPPNLARLLAALPGYFYSLSDDNTLWVHLYAENTLHFTFPDGVPLTLEVHTLYPWQGDITLTVRGTGTFALNLRLPGWCPDPTLTLNGSPLDQPLIPGTYHTISRTWTVGDTIMLHLPMPVRYLASHPAVTENTARVALQRGPLLYCLETADNPIHLDEIYLDPTQSPAIQSHPGLLGGITTLHLSAFHRPPTSPWNNHLYRPITGSLPLTIAPASHTLTAIPYYAWANRTPGQMRVWLRSN